MNIKSLALVAGSAALVSLSACNNTATTDKNETDTSAVANTAPISIEPVTGSPDFPDAKLDIKDVKATMQGSDSVKITVNYNVGNYELKNQTGDAAGKECNNSKDGQHIHFILDNQPYQALYEPTKTFTVAVNSEHYLMSFLSRSYHESVKAPGAGVLYHFSVDGKGKLTKMDIPQTPMIFYSRPKGQYIGNDTKNILLDFYVYNTQLAPNGNKVKVNAGGTDFTIDTWQAYFIKNAPTGDMTVTVQLVDKDGNNITGANTNVSRTINLAAGEPVK